MNIFKTLASGSGSINEPNVSAFLGYLLNPKEDHGLGDAFLRRFLEPLLKQNKQLDFMRNRDLSIRDLSIRSNFEFEVLLEQAFPNDGDPKEIVDIVILCYEKEYKEGMFLAEAIIKQKAEGQKRPKHIFLIENKIKDTSVTSNQLKNQYEQTIKKLSDKEGINIDKPEGIVSAIFVTPEGKYSTDEFKNFSKIDNNTDNKYHLLWHKDNKNASLTNDDTYISTIIKDIINSEYPPINIYCKYTLQAFLEFIEKNFQSTINEELKVKKLRENPRFEYKGKIYSRPKLAEKIIIDYIENYKKNHNEEITFEKLGTDLFQKKMDGATPPFVKAEEAKDKGRTKGGGDRDYFCYYNNPIQIAKEKICVCRGCSDEELIDLINEAKLDFKLDDIRI